MQIDSKNIPAGMVLIKKGGRPKADARNLAVYLTRVWRTEILGEQVKQADAWILDHWGNSNGITEESTIRRAIRAAKEGPMIDHWIIRHANFYDPRTALGIYEGPVIYEVFPVDEKCVNGATVWTWKEGMKYAHQYTLNAPQINFVLVDELPQLSEEELAALPTRRPSPPLPGL